MEIFFTAIAAALVSAFITWIIKTKYYSKWFHKPKLYINVPTVLFRQTRPSGSYSYRWQPIIQITNSSSFNAYNIQVSHPENFELQDSNNSMTTALPIHNSILANEVKEFRLESTSVFNADEIQNAAAYVNRTGAVIRSENGNRYSNPERDLMPDEIRNIRINLKYNNERGGKFYTRYTRLNNEQTNKFI